MSVVSVAIFSVLLSTSPTAVTDASRRTIAQQIPGSTAQAPAGGSKPKLLEIDGNKNPELVPQHAVWTFGLHLLAPRGKASPGTIESIRFRELLLSDREWSLLRAAAEKLWSFEEEADKRNRKLLVEKPFNSGNTRELKAAFDASEMAVRVEALRIGDELLASLSDEGRVTLNNWIQSLKKNISITVLESALANYLKPR